MQFIKKNRVKISSINPYREKKTLIVSDNLGKKVKRTCEPSRGGIGKRLKTANRRLTKTTAEKAKNRESFSLIIGKKRINIPNIPARKRLEKGPASATFISAYFPRRLKGFIGTAFAPPIINPVGRIIIIKGRIMV